MCSTRTVEGIMHMMFVEPDYDRWLCNVVLFELHMGLGGVFARGDCSVERERMPRGMARLALCGSGTVVGPVPLTVTSQWHWCFAHG